MYSIKHVQFHTKSNDMARIKAKLQISVRIREITKGLLTCYLCDQGCPERAWSSSFWSPRASPTKNHSW